jgi:hypothetical protein
MRLSVRTAADLARAFQEDFVNGEKAVTRSMKEAAAQLKADWRGQITGAGLGSRLANAIRSAHYPVGTDSMNAAALVWSNAPKITAAFEAGPLIRSARGFYLAIPTPAAGVGRRGRKMTPSEWEARNGLRLRYVFRPGKPALLVADDARINAAGQARAKKGRRRKDGVLTGAQTVVIFVLVPQIKIAKRLNLAAAATRVGNGISARIVANWKD